MTTPRDWNEYCSNAKEDPVNGLSLEWRQEWTDEWSLRCPKWVWSVRVFTRKMGIFRRQRLTSLGDEGSWGYGARWRHQGVGEGRPELHRHSEGNKGKSQSPGCRTGGPFYPWKTVKKEKVVAALAGALGRPDLSGLCRHNGYNGEASRGNDSTSTTESHDWGEQSLGEPVRVWERQVHSGLHPGCGGHQQ